MLTRASREQARRYFIANIEECIKEARAGTIKVNDLNGYIVDLEDRIEGHRSERYDHTLTFRQMATYYQTGEMRAILP